MKTSVFKTYRTEPELILPVPEVGRSYGVYGTGRMEILIGKSDGGTLGKYYVNERWYGELRYSGRMLDSVEFSPFFEGPINHITAGREYVKILNGNFADSWMQRLNFWANDAFDLTYMQG